MVEEQRRAIDATPTIPELGVGTVVQRHVHGRDAVGERAAKVLALVVVAQVDDRADAVRPERRPAGGGEAVRRLGANHRPPAGGPAIGRAEAAEVAGVAAAFPIQVPIGGHSITSTRSSLAGP
jgi:hypothetical protein